LINGSVAIQASPIDDAIVAAMKLSEAPNYSWSCAIVDDAKSYDIDGKWADGFAWQRQPMPKTVGERIGRDAGYDLEAIFHGPLEYVVRTGQGWRTLAELPKRDPFCEENNNWIYTSAPLLRTADMPADVNDLSFGLPPAIWVPIVRDRDDTHVYSNAQFALALPHRELAIVVSSYDAFKVDGNTATGSLTDVGAQLLLVHQGHEYIRPVVAGGRFKLWFTNGLVTKYTIDLAGVVVFEEKPIYVRQTATTVVKDVGTTGFYIPPDALHRLAAK
jgi:hypothetical protein